MREPAPSYVGEGPHVLWHVSEDPTIGRFEVAGIELRVVSNLGPIWNGVAASTLEFSGMRRRNATPARG